MSNNKPVFFAWRNPEVSRQFRTGVSLHSHTMHSQESLSFIPLYADRVPILGAELRRLAKRHEERYGRAPDYSRGYWTPPLPEREAYQLEKGSIEKQLDLAALVSLTDHDNIEAGLLLRQSAATATAPLSIEWTVPVQGTYFHVGVHNLPPEEAPSLVAAMVECTRQPAVALRNQILEAVTRHRQTLVVLNHPLWDQPHCGGKNHSASLQALLAESGRWFHALELNGLRPWTENQEVMRWAVDGGYPVVSGGDRHGCEPAAVINLTNATCFSAFASELRDGHSVVSFLNHYREPRGFRLLKSVSDIMGMYPHLPSRERWSDRVFCHRYRGDIVPLSKLWSDETRAAGPCPLVVRMFERISGLTQCKWSRRCLRLCFGGARLTLRDSC